MNKNLLNIEVIREFITKRKVDWTIHCLNRLNQRNISISDVKNAIPGDLIVYNHEHVAIYIGNNRIVHAASKKTGIKIGDKADYKSILSIRRLVE